MEFAGGLRAKIARGTPAVRDPYTVVPHHDGVLLCLTLCRHRDALSAPVTGRTWTHTTIELRSQMRMLLSFQRPSSLTESASFRGASPTRRPGAPAGRPESIARTGLLGSPCGPCSGRENGQPQPSADTRL